MEAEDRIIKVERPCGWPPPPPPEEKQQSVLLPLDQPRVIAIRDGKHIYTFHFARITQSDWERYFASIHITSKNEGRSQVNVLDLDTAGLDLFESKLVKVEGYAGGELTKDNFWRVPPRHSNPVAWLLRFVSASDETDDAPFNPECVEVKIDALWSQTDPATTTLYKGLVHRFSPPTAAQKKRIYRAGAMSKVVGGSRNGITVYAGRHKVLLDLYDELIQSVDGYCCGSSDYALEPAVIRREMDALHKFTAAQQLFLGGAAPAAESEAEAA